MRLRAGDYVQVIRTPDPWEGSGEELKDRESYLEHIGVVVEANEEVGNREDGEYYDMVLVRFPRYDTLKEETTQRNIESFSLRLMSRPYTSITTIGD